MNLFRDETEEDARIIHWDEEKVKVDFAFHLF